MSANTVIQKLNGAQTELGSVRVSVADTEAMVNGFACPAQAGKKEDKENLKHAKASRKFASSALQRENGQQPAFALFGSSKQVREPVNVRETQNSNSGVDKSRLIDATDAYCISNIENNTCNTSLMIKTQSPVQMTKDSTDNSDVDARHAIRVTHDEPAQLAEKRVLKAFRRFGRVFGMLFDESSACWTLEYGSSKEIAKVFKVLTNNKLFGYKLVHEEANKLSINDVSPTACSLRFTPSSKDISVSQKCAVKTQAHRSSIRIELHSKTLTLESLCLDVARCHIPVQISLGYDSVRRTHFCVADFRFAHEAAEVLVSLGQARRDLTCKFTD